MPVHKIDTSLNNSLQTFLKSHGTDGGSFTHTSIGNPKGSYSIPNTDINEFMAAYTRVAFEENIPVHLTEGIKDCEYTPLKIDIDFRYYKNNLERIYELDDIIKICSLYMECLELYLESPDDNERMFYILEKPSPTYEKDKAGNFKERDGLKRVKDGVHIMAPKIITNNNLQLKCRDYVINKCAGILDKYNFDTSYCDIFDKAVIDRNNWQMYGSTKPGQPPYKLSNIAIVWSDRHEIVVNSHSNLELVSLLSVRNKSEYSLIKTDKEAEIFTTYEKKKVNRPVVKSKKGIVKTCSEKELKLIIEYVDCLDKKRASNYATWMELGWCLHNLHNKDDTLLNKWIDFSKYDPKYSLTAESECRDFWQTMAGDGLGIGSLKLWAKKDNLTRYNIIVQKDIGDYILKACKDKKGNSVDVARVIHAMYKDFHICVSVKDDVWFYYSDELNKWIRDDKGITLKRKFSTDVYTEFSKLQQIKQSQSTEADDHYAQESLRIMTVMSRLKDTAFKSNIKTECVELFYDKDHKFLELLDSHSHLLGFNNGVLDLRSDEFRLGRPEDYISMSTKINYMPYDPNDQDIKEIMNMYKSIFVIEKVREYILKRTSSFLSGSTKDETFDIYSGGGGNGKSKHIELLEACLGDYACKLPITLLTQKRGGSGNATPEIARTKGKRLCTLQEPDSKTKINVGLMKELTGGDKIQARALYNEPFEFKPQFKLILCCNDKPELPTHDDGTWRRIKNTEFLSKFQHEIKKDNVLTFKINDKLSAKFDSWAEPFMSILVHYHKLYRTNGIKAPDEIDEYTNEYRATNNHFKEFANDCIEEDTGSKEIYTTERIYDTYKKWYKESQCDTKSKKRSELKIYLDEKFGMNWSSTSSNKDRGYIGIKLKELNNSSNSEGVVCNIMDDEDTKPDGKDELDN